MARATLPQLERLYWQSILLAPAPSAESSFANSCIHEPHHTPDFWRAVEIVLPHWEPRRRWLTEHDHDMLI